MNRILVLLALVALAFSGCLNDGGTEIPNELSGNIVTTDGKGVGNAEVTLSSVGHVPGDTGSGSDPVFKALTDSKGHYVFKNAPQGQYNVLAAKEGLASLRDSIPYGGGAVRLPADTLSAPGGLVGWVRLQPQHDPRTATVQVLGTEAFVNVDSAGGFTLPGLAAGSYRLRVVTILPDYAPLFATARVEAGKTDTLAAALAPFYSGIPVVTGLRTAPGPEGTGTLKLTWNQAAYGKVEAYLIYRDSAGQTLPSQTPIGRTGDTVFVDTIYSMTPGAGQHEYLDTLDHPVAYRVRILDKTGALGPFFGSEPGTAVPPSRKFVSGLWKLGAADAGYPKGGGKVVVFKDKLWMFVNPAPASQIWTSSDGLAWEKAAAKIPWSDSMSVGITPLSFNGKLWVMKTNYTDLVDLTMIDSLWSSSDGVNWNLVNGDVQFPGRSEFVFAAFQGKMWIIDGGNPRLGASNDLWQSADGVQWQEVSLPDDWNGSSEEGVDTLGGNLWVLGGADFATSSYRRNIGTTSDGVTWSLARYSAEFQLRVGHAVVSHGGRLWLIAGWQVDYKNQNEYAYTLMGDAWSSPDGVTWSLADAHAPFGPRARHSAVSFRGKLWIFGGSDSAGKSFNDAWYLGSP